MEFFKTLGVIVISTALAFWAATLSISPQTTEVGAPSAFQRVMKTNTLRCGYLVMPPQFTRNPNTGEMSGVAFDLMTEIAKRLNIKVQWAEEVSFMTVAEAMKTGRIDAFCLTAYRWVPGLREMDYTNPIFYSTTSAYVRADDHRFDDDLKTADSADVTVATLDGEASTFIRNEDFPRSNTYSLPASTDPSFILEAVAAGKADITFSNQLMVMPYLTANPGKVRRVESGGPVRLYSHAFGFAKGEQDMLNTFNVILEEMRDDGTIDAILDKYEAVPDSFIRMKSPIGQRR